MKAINNPNPGLAAIISSEDNVLKAEKPEENEFFIGFGNMNADLNLSPSGDVHEAAANLFAYLRLADKLAGSKNIAMAPIPENGLGLAINDRIRLTSILMGSGRFWYMPGAASLADALATALWSGQHPGEDTRLDDGTTDIDTLDAFEYTIERERARLLKL